MYSKQYKQKRFSVKKQAIKKEATVLETFPNGYFKVRFDDGKQAHVHLSGRLRLYKIRILAGDRVLVELSPYDETKGRIIYRLKS